MRNQPSASQPAFSVFYVGLGSRAEHFPDANGWPRPVEPGWYWQDTLATPKPEPVGPFDSHALAIFDVEANLLCPAREGGT